MFDLTFVLFLLICMTYTQTHAQRYVSKYTSTNVCVCGEGWKEIHQRLAVLDNISVECALHCVFSFFP